MVLERAMQAPGGKLSSMVSLSWSVTLGPASQGVPTGAITGKSRFLLIELRPALQEGIHIWYSKPGQESAPSEEITSAVWLTGHDVPACQLPSTQSC